MLNILIMILILPFTPAWMYGDVFHSEHGIVKGVSQAVENFSNKKDAAENSDDRFAENTESKEGETDRFQEFNLLPIDKAFAYGLQPFRKTDAGEIKIWAGSSVAIDVGSGTILHYDNGRKRTQIASLTKMMTAVLTVENIKDLDEEVTITAGAINLTGTTVGCPTSVICNSNRMYPGEKVKAIDLLKAMLMNSANDAAVSLAIHVGGSEKKFVEMMNKKAQEMGLKDTHFCTASGLELDGQEDQCYSSAYDIARIGAYSLQHDIIWSIMRIPDGRFYSADGNYMHELKNTDILLNDLPNCIGGKTGFTPLAGRSLLMGAVDPSGKHKIISVILNDENRWEDMRSMVNWIFSSYSWQ